MGKTNAIIEILVIGIITLIGFLLNIIGFLEIEKSEILQILTSLKDYSSLLTIITLALSYQLGWIMNGFTGQFYPKILRNKAKKKYNISVEEYQKIRNIVYLEASDTALLKIKERLSGIRLLRSSIINIFIIIIGFCSLHYYYIIIFLLPLLIISAIITHHMYDKYTGQLIHTYNQLKKLSKDKE
jgi:hypothetical protein